MDSGLSSFPNEIWPQIWSDNPQERLNREIRRRTDVVGIYPDRGTVSRLVGAMPAEQHDEWIEGRRYVGLEVLQRSGRTLLTSPATEEVKRAADSRGDQRLTCRHRITWWPNTTSVDSTPTRRRHE